MVQLVGTCNTCDHKIAPINKTARQGCKLTLLGIECEWRPRYAVPEDWYEQQAKKKRKGKKR